MRRKISFICFFICLCLGLSSSYSALQDARIIKEYKLSLRENLTENKPDLNHAQIARRLVNQVDWASVGTVSTNNFIKDYPMVNIISINDQDDMGNSTGRIQFLLTDLDFTGPDWQQNNKATFLFSEEQLQQCSNPYNFDTKRDPMEPTCARAIFSGQIVKIDRNGKEYDSSLVAFVQRHPAAKSWIITHKFYLCELDIQNIFVLDYYGGPQTVTSEDYYKTHP